MWERGEDRKNEPKWALSFSVYNASCPTRILCVARMSPYSLCPNIIVFHPDTNHKKLNLAPCFTRPNPTPRNSIFTRFLSILFTLYLINHLDNLIHILNTQIISENKVQLEPWFAIHWLASKYEHMIISIVP
jgi:hypothetical protein